MARVARETDWLTWGPLAVMFVGLIPLALGTLLLAWTGVLNRIRPVAGIDGATLIAGGFVLLVAGLLALEGTALHRDQRDDLEGLVPVGIIVGVTGIILGVGPGVLRESVLGPLPSLAGAVAFLSNAWLGTKLHLADARERAEANEAPGSNGPPKSATPEDEREP